MAIKTVKATINGQTYDLTLNSASGKWEATITAPGKTSYNLAGGYYNVSVEATNEAGTKGSADASTVDGLKLVVKETVAPVITIVSPTAGAYVANSKQPVVFNITDETGGSGVDISTLVVKQDGTAVAAANITHTAITNGYSVTYTPSAALSDGSHTVTINCKDHDGNAATEKSTDLHCGYCSSDAERNISCGRPYYGGFFCHCGRYYQRCNVLSCGHYHLPERNGSGDNPCGHRRHLLQGGYAERGQQHHHCQGKRRGREGKLRHPDSHAGHVCAEDQSGDHYA